MSIMTNLKQKLKAVGRIDLATLNDKIRPDKVSKEERAALRIKKEEEMRQYNREMIISTAQKKVADLKEQIECTREEVERLTHDVETKRAEMKERKQAAVRLEYLQRKQAVRKKYAASTMSTGVRQKDLHFNGIRPEKMDVVHFHVPKTSKQEEMDGVALVKDENHYYLAIDMYDYPDREDNITSIIDENPDGTFEGIWPEHVVLKEASKVEERFMRALADKYGDDLDKADALIADTIEKERIEREQLTEGKGYSDPLLLNDLSTTETALETAEGALSVLEGDLSKAQEELRRLENGEEPPTPAHDGEEESMPALDMTDLETRCPHLPFLRGKAEMLTMDWPVIGTDILPHLRFRLMGNIARVVRMLNRSHALTYLLSESYFEELRSRAAKYYKGMTINDVVAEGTRSDGVIVFPNQGHEDTVLYAINRQAMLNVIIVYIREGRLLFYENYSRQEILNNPRVDYYMCHSLQESGTDPAMLYVHLRNMVVSFLAMERDMERTVNNLVDEGAGERCETDLDEGKPVNATNDKDVVIRDANWYTDITVNREIPVRGYLSHRWCGSGKNKHLCEVWVRPHERSGYHRAAGVRNEGQGD